MALFVKLHTSALKFSTFQCLLNNLTNTSVTISILGRCHSVDVSVVRSCHSFCKCDQVATDDFIAKRGLVTWIVIFSHTWRYWSDGPLIQVRMKDQENHWYNISKECVHTDWNWEQWLNTFQRARWMEILATTGVYIAILWWFINMPQSHVYSRARVSNSSSHGRLTPVYTRTRRQRVSNYEHV